MDKTAFLWAIVFTALLVGLALFLARPQISLENSLERQIEPSMAILGGNTLISVSTYGFKGEVRGDLYDPIPDMIEKIVMCESSGNHEGVWGKAGEFGIAQFKKESFYLFAKMAGFENADWKNKEHQLYLLEWGLRNGKENHWVCFMKIFGN